MIRIQKLTEEEKQQMGIQDDPNQKSTESNDTDSQPAEIAPETEGY